jgi:ribosomal protein S6
VRESQIEAYFVKRVKQAGGLQRKFVSPGHRSVADRIAGFAVGRFAFVELKATSSIPRDDQLREHARWRRLGFKVYVIDSYEGVDAFIKEMTEC